MKPGAVRNSFLFLTASIFLEVVGLAMSSREKINKLIEGKNGGNRPVKRED